MSKEPPLNFSSIAERDKWITDNADYFSVIRRLNRHYSRYEFPTLAEAEAGAERMTSNDPEARYLIYAVAGRSDCWVKTITQKREANANSRS